MNQYIDRDYQPFSPLNKNKRQQQFRLHSTLSKIADLIEHEQEFGHSSNMLTLASATDNTFHFHDDSAHVLNRYVNRQVVFIGIWGPQSVEKTFFYDCILRLCGVSQQKCKMYCMGNNDHDSISFFERPFIKDNMRIFLLSCKGYRNGHKLNKSEKLQLDFLMSVCSIVILVEQVPTNQNRFSQNIVELGIDHFSASFKRLYINKADGVQWIPKEVPSWPQSLFVLYSNKQSIRKHEELEDQQQLLREMFSQFNFSLLHSDFSMESQKNLQSYISVNNPLDQLYLKNTSSVFLNIYCKLQPKTILNLKMTGFTTPSIIMQLINSLNHHNSIYLPKTIDKIKRSVYQQIYNRHTLNYILKLKEKIDDDHTYSTEYFIRIFHQNHQEIFRSWDLSYRQVITSNRPDPTYDQYEEKLQKYIDEKQRDLLMVNQKKSVQKFSKKPKLNRQFINPNKKQYEQYLDLKEMYPNMDHLYDVHAQTYQIGTILKQIYGGKQGKKNEKVYLECQQKRLVYQKQLKQLMNLKGIREQKEQNNKKERQEYQRILSQEEDILKQIDEYTENIKYTKTKKYDSLTSNQSLKQQLLQKHQRLNEEMRRVGQFRRQLERDHQKIIEKQQLLSSKLDQKKQSVSTIQQSIFESKIKLYEKNKYAERRIIKDQPSENVQQ